MAINYSEGAPTIGVTEYFLVSASTTQTPQTTEGTVQVFIDTAAVAAGDQFLVRAYEKTRTADTQRRIGGWFITGTQSDPQWVSAAFVLSRGWEWSITKIAGTDRALPYSVRRIA